MRWLLYPFAALLGLITIGVAIVAIAVASAWPTLPSLEALTDYHPKIPLRVYTADGALIGEYGEERRAFIRIQDVPPVLKQAILAAEDDRFYQHSGVDFLGILRAAGANLATGGKRQGASTITMQVARNFFLTREKTISRKLYEILLAFKIEQNLTKDQILEVYINQIFLGRRAYGFAVASHTYFGKPIRELSVAEAAMLAGLPKAPSAYNPVVNPKRAAQRQQYVLRRMLELGFINEAEQREAIETPLKVVTSTSDFGGSADYVAEMARQIAYEQFQEEAYTRGIKVITTINKAEQDAAYRALRRGILDYDRRHGYRGAEAYVDPARMKGEQGEALDEILAETPDYDDMLAAIVTEARSGAVTVYRYGETIRISGDGLRFAERMVGEKGPPNKRIRAGAIVRITRNDNGRWEITQLPEVEGALEQTLVDCRRWQGQCLDRGAGVGRPEGAHRGHQQGRRRGVRRAEPDHRQLGARRTGGGAQSVDSGLPFVYGRDDVKYIKCSDEHGVVEDPNGVLKVNDKLRLVPGHCDPTCNVHDWYVGVRNGKVESVWPVSARGKAY